MTQGLGPVLGLVMALAGPAEPDRDPDPDPPIEPEPPADDPEPLPPDPPVEPTPPDEPADPEPPDRTPRPPGRLKGAPNVDVDVADRGASIDLGGDLIIKPKCNDKGNCDGGRIGFHVKLPVLQESPTGGERAAVDSLNGFSTAWRVGLVGDYLRDVTKETGPATFYLLTLGVDWGVQTFRYFPDAGVNASRRTRHSISGLARFLAYLYQPRRYRLAPQLLVRYDRNWAGAPEVGVVIPGQEPTDPDTTTDVVISPPGTRPVMSITVPVLFSIQKGRRVLPQLGFGPTARVAFAGGENGYNPFDDAGVFRGEFWLYWYPTGTEGLDVQKTNVRIGVSPFVDVRFAGRTSDQPLANYGALVEVKVGVRGYEY